MGLPRLQTCCLVFDLKTGNILLGGINAFLSFVMVVVMIMAATMVGSLEEAASADPEANAALTGILIWCIALVLLFVAKFAFDVFFVYGVVHGRAGVIQAYFIMWTVFFILTLFSFFYNAFHFHVGTICFMLFYIGVNVYAILLSHSFYMELNEREEV